MSLWKISFIQNTNEKISEIFALASKEKKKKKNKGTLLYQLGVS